MSGSAGEHLTVDVLSTRPPKEAVVPSGRNSFAVADGAVEIPEKRASIVSLRDPEAGSRASSVEDPDRYPPPSTEERLTLRKVADSIPFSAWSLCIVELAERASYYGVQTIFNNFIEFPLPPGGPGSGAVAKDDPNGTAGALGMGLQTASALTTLFLFLAYVVPIFGAWVADTKLGRYKTIAIGVLVCGVSHIIMICGAIPSVLMAGHGVAPFMVSFFLLAIGAGIFKPNVAPTVIDQYHHQREYTKTLKSGEKVLVDPEVTIQRIMLIFYGCINVGAFFAIATTYAEKYVGYWLAYLLPGIVYFLLPILLLVMYKRTIKKPPMGSEMTNFFKILGMAIKKNKGKLWGKGFFDKVKPSVLSETGETVTWTDKNVEDVKRTLVACQIFLYFPIYNINDGGIGAVATNQAASMTTNGAPNDLLSNFNPLTIIVTIPLLSHVIYPTLRKYNIKFGRITRITLGFLFAAFSGVIGAIVQYRVYKTSPCGYYASTCDSVSPISVWWQIPNVSLGAISECFCNVTAYELAYARAPPNMKALVMAMFLFTTALSSALAEVINPAINDPHLIWVWAGPAIALFVQTAIFYYLHRNVDYDEFMLYEADSNASAGGLIANENAQEHFKDVDFAAPATEKQAEHPPATTTTAPTTTTEAETTVPEIREEHEKNDAAAGAGAPEIDGAAPAAEEEETKEVKP